MKTFSPTPEHINHEWFVVDADGQILGRLATQIANRLRGKHKPEYAPHMDNGDFIVVINCEKIKVTGAKLENKKYYRHSGYVGGLRETSLGSLMEKNCRTAPAPSRDDASSTSLGIFESADMNKPAGAKYPGNCASGASFGRKRIIPTLD